MKDFENMNIENGNGVASMFLTGNMLHSSPGPPHFRRKKNEARGTGYTPAVIMSELADFPIQNKSDTKIHFNFLENKLSSLTIQDSYTDGFNRMLQFWTR